MASAQLTGVGNILPIRGSSSREAALARANHLVHGYVDLRNGKPHFEFSIEDAATRKMQAVTVDGDVLQASNALARAVDPTAHPFPSSMASAIEAWAKRDFTRAVALDPDFGLAWRDLVQSQMQQQQPQAAMEAVKTALQRPKLRSEIDRAQLEFLLASLQHDEAGIIKAGTELARLQPNDTNLVRTLADRQTNARHFPEAIRLYKQVMEADPDDALVINSLGYAQFFSGDLDAARKSFEEYSKRPGQAANAADSLGEVFFMAGQFAEAERLFKDAHAKNPALLNGGDLMKAGYAHWLTGDLPGADKLMEQYFIYRSQQGDQAIPWRRAIWEYSTGRAGQAMARLKSAAGPVAEIAQRQLLVWQNVDGLVRDPGALQRAYLNAPPSSDGLVRTLYANALWRAGRNDEAAKLIALWPLPETGDPLVQSVQFPMFQAVRNGLGKR
jgi:tetratricopeptide (TPR) repeat protein